MNERYYIGEFTSEIGELFILTDEYSLYKIAFSSEDLKDFIDEHLKDQKLLRDEMPIIKETKSQLKKYFLGENPYYFSIPLTLKGTKFQKSVWREIEKIPYGQTTSYKDLAISLEDENYSRAVGGACGGNPIPIIIPCHRVIRSDDELGGYSGRTEIKRKLLSLENAKS